jgi:hypothetical protein
MTDHYQAARDIIKKSIAEHQATINDLQAADALLGGFQEPDVRAAKPVKKLAPARKPKQYKKRRTAKSSKPKKSAMGEIAFDGKSVFLKKRHYDIVNHLEECGPAAVSKADLAGFFGDATPNWPATVKSINRKLAGLKIAMVAVAGGYQLQGTGR